MPYLKIERRIDKMTKRKSQFTLRERAREADRERVTGRPREREREREREMTA